MVVFSTYLYMGLSIRSQIPSTSQSAYYGERTCRHVAYLVGLVLKARLLGVAMFSLGLDPRLCGPVSKFPLLVRTPVTYD